ncbi:hypothetical protein EJ05DRAFT_14125 [Pseudovirgaria hyperparasitica]|uniref:DNA (cytosine-5)-methyltransferase 1 replication foci domain-containing protein n=1 Tax=Pseudovirgaria hyperparasitica TaxID=470096 RepID=A0A6A6WKS4_9PEZI|nr:uncharacterized protein EJ05DRAFT_14125 [Pseudovirgaria hyperparasitica]KAF2762772.1 hypothetical protein EJ05DRAFT_14125 [Pseudovirgaria hyperparasitica]
MPNFIAECNVLKPKDPTLKDNNDWELYTLNNAEVRDATTGELRSLLMADAMQPVTVTGNLEQVSRKQQKLLVRPEYFKSTPLKVENVMLFSYGEDPDDKDDPNAIQFWAAGEAGWFKIKPGRAYKSLHLDMQECIELLWFSADIYASVKKGATGPSAEMVFREFVEDEDNDCSTIEQARDRFYRHRHFLMLAMINGKEGIHWGRLGLRTHLRQHFPDDYQQMQDKSGLKSITNNDCPPGTSQHNKKGSEDPSRTSMSKQPTRSKAPKKDNNWFRAHVIWEVIQRAEVSKTLRPESMSIANIAKIMTQRYEIDEQDVAMDYIRSHATNVRYMMDHKAAKRSCKIAWNKISLFKELSKATISAATARKVNEVELKPRRQPVEEYHEPDEEEDEEEEDDLLAASSRARKGAGRPKNGRLSVLRPKTSTSAKGTKRMKAHPAGRASEDLSGSDGELEDAMDLSSPGKRPLDSDDESPPSKRRASDLPSYPETPANVPDFDEDDDEEDENENEDESSESALSELSSPEQLANQQIPLNFDPNVPSPPGAEYVSTIISTPLSSFQANAPGNVWNCTFDGCSHRVYGASSDGSQQLIKGHVKNHQREQQVKLDLLMSEEKRTRLPVSHLFNRIREMAAQQNPLATALAASAADANGFPLPIERRG